MLKKLGYEVTVFEKKSILSLSEMTEVYAGAERNCALEGCKTDCVSVCKECLTGYKWGADL